MATVTATVDHELEDASVATRRVAGEQGWALAEGRSAPGLLNFEKGVAAFSWGSRLTVRLEPVSDAQTRLRISTAEKFALTDLGRGHRAANRLLRGLGATIE
jgi:hypothetical protein